MPQASTGKSGELADPLPRRVLVTGASGFVGGHLRPLLESKGLTVVTLARDRIGGETLAVDAVSSVEEWARALVGIDVIVHLAAIAHMNPPPEPERLAAVNVRWPEQLFSAAAAAGVSDFVFLSSIKVFGDQSVRPFREDDPYAPDDAYGQSKVDAERALAALRAEYPDLRLSVLRAPLVYGPGVKANFRSLLGWAERGCRGWPLPFGAAQAPRSLISVRNLCEAIVACPGHSGTFHCADPRDLTVAELFRALGVPGSRLLPVPAALMRGLLGVSGLGSYYPRLYESLQLDTAASNELLDWSPPQSSKEALAHTMEWWHA